MKRKMPICEICGNEKFNLLTTQIREGRGRIIQCKRCGLVMQDLTWDNRQIAGYYKNKYQRTNSLVSGKIQSPREHFEHRLKTISPVFEQIRPYLKSRSKVIEIGCGPGALLSLIKPHVAKCIGIELHTPFVNFIKNRLKIEAYDKDINTLKLRDKFDLIICIATLDHLPNPLETLLTMESILSPSGRIYLEVPNFNEALNRFIPPENRNKYNEFFWHRAHFFYFSKNTISALIKKAGLKVRITCRHDYTLKNFLNWYFLGKPQLGLVIGMKDSEFFKGKSDFEKQTNRLFLTMEKKLKKVMSQTFSGDSLCCTARR